MLSPDRKIENFSDLESIYKNRFIRIDYYLRRNVIVTKKDDDKGYLISKTFKGAHILHN